MKNRKNKAAALVVTLIVLTALAVVAVAMITNTSLDRTAVASSANIYRAQLAAEAGLAEAKSFLLAAIGNRRNFITSSQEHSPDHQPVVLIARDDANDVTKIYPLVSGNLTQFNTANETHTVDFGAFYQAIQQQDPKLTANLNLDKNYENTNSTTRYNAPWVYIKNAEGRDIARYAFLVLDEQSKINPSFHQGLSTAKPEGEIRKISEIPLDSEYIKLVSDQGQIDQIKDAKNAILTKRTLALLVGKEAFEKYKHLLSDHNVIEEDVIPAGYIKDGELVPYVDAGKAKYDLNALATDSKFGATATARAENIGKIINDNIPDFRNREQALVQSKDDPKKYANRIAASIVDYIDTDSAPTSVNGGEPAGKDATPYAAGFAERNTFFSSSGGGPYTATIKSEFFVQLWNPYTKQVSGVVVLEIRGRQKNIQIGGEEVDFKDYVSG
jgi:hypothetical protein